MDKHELLLEFVIELIDVQIKKYVALASFGVGPDARVNGQLVLNEVEELLNIADELLNCVFKHNNSGFQNAFDQVHFYVEHEYLRGYAGWLIDPNNIHTPVYERVKKQKLVLQKIAKDSGIVDNSSTLPTINGNSFPLPKTKVQKQCQLDSYWIAFYILDLAVQLKNNLNYQLDDKIPQHARAILIKHAAKGGRYHTEEISKEIEVLHKQCSQFINIKSNESEKSTNKLDKKLALTKAKEHKAKLNSILERYQKCCPDSKLFAQDHTWHSVETSEQKGISTLTKLGLFGVAAAGTTIAYLITSLIENTPDASFESAFNLTQH